MIKKISPEGEALRSFKDEFRAALIRALQAYLVDNEPIEQQEELPGKQLEKRTKNNEKIIDILESLLWDELNFGAWI